MGTEAISSERYGNYCNGNRCTQISAWVDDHAGDEMKQTQAVDKSEDTTRKRVRSYTNAQLQGLWDALQFAIRPLDEEEQRYFDVLFDECRKELQRRELYLGE